MIWSSGPSPMRGTWLKARAHPSSMQICGDRLGMMREARLIRMREATTGSTGSRDPSRGPAKHGQPQPIHVTSAHDVTDIPCPEESRIGIVAAAVAPRSLSHPRSRAGSGPAFVTAPIHIPYISHTYTPGRVYDCSCGRVGTTTLPGAPLCRGVAARRASRHIVRRALAARGQRGPLGAPRSRVASRPCLRSCARTLCRAL
jgi:hypothetical protein